MSHLSSFGSSITSSTASATVSNSGFASSNFIPSSSQSRSQHQENPSTSASKCTRGSTRNRTVLKQVGHPERPWDTDDRALISKDAREDSRREKKLNGTGHFQPPIPAAATAASSPSSLQLFPIQSASGPTGTRTLRHDQNTHNHRLNLNQHKEAIDLAPILSAATIAHIPGPPSIPLPLIPFLISATHETTGASETSFEQKNQQQLLHHPSFWNSLTAMTVLDVMHTMIVQSVPQTLFRRQRLRLQRMHRRQMYTNCISTTTASGLASTSKRNRGIPNFGNTCFLNSILQALASMDPFLRYLDRLERGLGNNIDHDSSNNNSADYEATAFIRLLSSLLHAINGDATTTTSTAHTIDPRPLLQRIGQKHKQFRLCNSREQQDAQELLQALMEMICTPANIEQLMLFATDNTNNQESSLSLSSFLQQINASTSTKMQQEEEEKEQEDAETGTETQHQQPTDLPVRHGRRKKNLGDTSMLSSINDPNDDHQDDDRGEEKKQDEATVTTSALTDSSDEERIQETFPSESTTSRYFLLEDDDNDETTIDSNNSSSAMMERISTTSPLNGWVGSTLQCARCRHVRPIQNTPFLDIPLIPTAVTRYYNDAYNTNKNKNSPTSKYPSCTLATCLLNHTATERVSDVECRSCTLRREIETWEEEVYMLQGAVTSLAARHKLISSPPASSVSSSSSALVLEYRRAAAHLQLLRRLDPDQVDFIPAGPITDTVHDNHDCFAPDATASTCHRGDAFKCLLLTRLPTICCFHIQRRYCNIQTQGYSKAVQHVEFDEIMDLGQYCAYTCDSGITGITSNSSATNKRQQHRRQEPVLYKLVSVIEHQGNAFSGHYVTYRRNVANPQEWLLISDQTIQPISWRQVQAAQAYMLFYEAI